jgi:sortase (surface protein transpeptidase)
MAAAFPATPPPELSPRLAHTKTPPPTYVAKPIRRSRPIHLSIPIIGVSVPLSVLTLNKDGTVNVPTNFAVPGWYNGDQSPGQKGSAVILGHVDNYHGPAVFFHLDKLKLGNRVDVTLADGRKLVFAVIGERMYKKTNFPDKLVYGARNYPALQLVTCGGIFDSSTGHYLSNIVVFTALIKS